MGRMEKGVAEEGGGNEGRRKGGREGGRKQGKKEGGVGEGFGGRKENTTPEPLSYKAVKRRVCIYTALFSCNHRHVSVP